MRDSNSAQFVVNIRCGAELAENLTVLNVAGQAFTEYLAISLA
jgi:hypothetical protein